MRNINRRQNVSFFRKRKKRRPISARLFSVKKYESAKVKGGKAGRGHL